jgi:hypothetical protein
MSDDGTKGSQGEVPDRVKEAVKDLLEGFLSKFDTEERNIVAAFILQYLRRKTLRLSKLYPSVTTPNSGDTLTKNGATTFTITIQSNHPHDPNWPHAVRITDNELNFAPASPSVEVPVNTGDWVQNGSTWSATVTLRFPSGTGDFIVMAYRQGENLTVPIHHVDKVAVTINS